MPCALGPKFPKHIAVETHKTHFRNRANELTIILAAIVTFCMSSRWPDWISTNRRTHTSHCYGIQFYRQPWRVHHITRNVFARVHEKREGQRGSIPKQSFNSMWTDIVVCLNQHSIHVVSHSSHLGNGLKCPVFAAQYSTRTETVRFSKFPAEWALFRLLLH